MLWRCLTEFRDAGIAKLYNLRRARRAGLAVPEPTLWAAAAEVERARPRSLDEVGGALRAPLIVRSGSPTEDSVRTSNAGQFLSLPVLDPEEFSAALRRVTEALPRPDGQRQGVIFLQPVVAAPRAGVTFFDGFYYEETSAPRDNAGLTSGAERGDVRRGHLQRGEAHSAWLTSIHRVFGGRLDLEWVERDGGVRVLLQVRPALFPVRRNETLSLANHKEILGDPPSPWMVGVLAEAGRTVMRFFASAEPAVAAWEEPYSIELGERAWMNFSAFFRLMDHWGLPRTTVTEGVGGEARGPEDARFRFSRLVRKAPTLLRMGVQNYAAIARISRRMAELDSALDSARDLRALQALNVRALEISIRTNFAIMQILSIASKIRRALGLRQAAHVVTHVMMERYAQLAARPDLADRLAGLDAWLAEYGHRGPLESDPWHPRFAELRGQLEEDLRRGPSPLAAERSQPSVLAAALGRFLFLPDEWRERFRDRLMKWWQRLRLRILDEARRTCDAGLLDELDDVFFLRREDIESDPSTWRARMVHRRRSWERAKLMVLPTTASRDEIAEAIRRSTPPECEPAGRRFSGIGLGTTVVSGTAVVGTDVASLLAGPALPDVPILIADTLEPSWSVVFPRFAAVVADLGGELSHAAILLREAGITAVVNAQGSFRQIADGDRVRVDPIRGEVVVEARAITHTTHRHPSGILFNKTS